MRSAFRAGIFVTLSECHQSREAPVSKSDLIIGAAGIAISRRSAVAGLGRSAALLLLSSVASCADATEAPEEDSDDVLLSRILASPEPHIPRRQSPYRVTRTLIIPAGKTVTIEPETRIIWINSRMSRDMQARGSLTGVFEAGGNHSGIEVTGGGKAFVECETPNPMLYAAMMRGKRGFSVIGVQARECQHVYIDAAVTGYDKIRVSGRNSNIARDVRISGGGARYTKLPTTGQGACLLAYVANCHISHVHYENVPHGIQWWGGDSGLEPWQNGARNNERKCEDLIIESASVNHALGGGIWGSMGRRIVVRDCSVEACEDVGFDAEGCVDTTFERCTSRNSHNGCFATFFLCDNIRFINCRGYVDNKSRPLFRVYNVTQSNSDNRNVQVLGGNFSCSDPSGPSTMDCAMGPVQDLTISGATLENVRIDTVFLNMHRTRILENTLSFPYPLPSVPAIRAGASQGIMKNGKVIPGGAFVENNRIHYTAPTSLGAPIAIEIYEGDFNLSAASEVIGNTINGPFAVGVSVINATGNAGVIPSFDIRGNRFSSLAPKAKLLAVTQKGPHARRPTVHWDDAQTRDGRTVPMRAALS
jgi:hypothetical protein